MTEQKTRAYKPGGVPPGVRGAGWLLAVLLIFMIFELTASNEGWTFGGSNPVASAPPPPAPPPHHARTRAAN